MPPSVITTLPEEVVTFVMTEEDGSRAYYEQHYVHWDWPAGASGPTFGPGYDCGYCTPDEVQADWAGIITPAEINVAVSACGLRGEAAREWVLRHKNSVTVTYDQGLQEFRTREVPKWLGRCRAALPNFDELPPLSAGAIFSLSFNRGTGGYEDPSARDVEMRAIRQFMIAKSFVRIPAEIRSMQRLWPRGGDLWRRRAHEADLFQRGLAAPASAAAIS